MLSDTIFGRRVGFVGVSGLTLGRQSTIVASGTNTSRILKPVLVDALRLWGVDRTPSEISAYMRTPCSGFGTIQPILCFVYRSGASTITDAGPGSSVVGLIVPSNSDTCQIFDDTTVGYCSPGKPLLPGRGFAYEPADFASLIGSLDPMTFVDLLEQPPLVDVGGNMIEAFSGCATRPLRFLNNKVFGGNGGAIYQSGCDVARDAQGFCFFSGLTQASGAAVVEFQGNYAEGSGGAVFTDCDTLATSCAAMLQASLGFPPIRSSSRSQPQYYFARNTAGGYGGNVATAPSQLIIPVRDGGNLGLGLSRQTALFNAFDAIAQGGGLPNTRLSYIPGQNVLDLSLLLLDGVGQIVRGSTLVPLTYVAVSLLCTPGGSACSYNTALHGPVFNSFNPISGICQTIGVNQSGLQDLVCPIGGTSVLVQVSLFGSASPYLSRTVQMTCLACSAGQSRTEGVANGAESVRSWSCRSCLPTQYVVDPNRHPCRQCPGDIHRNFILFFRACEPVFDFSCHS
jgi:predicted outer membrane repeat protein